MKIKYHYTRRAMFAYWNWSVPRKQLNLWFALFHGVQVAFDVVVEVEHGAAVWGCGLLTGPGGIS